MDDSLNVAGVALLVVVAVFAIFVISALFRAVVVVRQTQAYLVERLGRYNRTMDAGLHLLVPFIDRVRAKVDFAKWCTRSRHSPSLPLTTWWLTSTL